MADTTFVSMVTKIATGWAQDVNDCVYKLLQNAKTPAQARAAL